MKDENKAILILILSLILFTVYQLGVDLMFNSFEILSFLLEVQAIYLIYLLLLLLKGLENEI